MCCTHLLVLLELERMHSPVARMECQTKRRMEWGTGREMNPLLLSDQACHCLVRRSKRWPSLVDKPKYDLGESNTKQSDSSGEKSKANWTDLSTQHWDTGQLPNQCLSAVAQLLNQSKLCTAYVLAIRFKQFSGCFPNFYYFLLTIALPPAPIVHGPHTNEW